MRTVPIILEIARQEDVPVVTHMLRGSVADTIYNFAVKLDCPVLVVKEKNI